MTTGVENAIEFGVSSLHRSSTKNLDENVTIIKMRIKAIATIVIKIKKKDKKRNRHKNKHNVFFEDIEVKEMNIIISLFMNINYFQLMEVIRVVINWMERLLMLVLMVVTIVDIVVLHQWLKKVVFGFAPKAFHFPSCEIAAIKVGCTKQQSEMNAFAPEQIIYSRNLLMYYQKKILMLKNVLIL